MNNYSTNEISEISIHKVGNKLNNDGIKFSKKNTPLKRELNEILLSYFITPFKSDEYYNLYHNTDINLNEVFSYACQIFDSPGRAFEQSINLAKHLYDCSTHPKIKGGEFYTVYFKTVVFEGSTVDAIGLFKSETEDIFLKVKSAGEIYIVESESGINVNKLDKGCLIFNKDRKKGFVVSVIDNSSRGENAIYWVDNFLQLRERNDDYHNTENILSVCKQFITKELPNEFEMSKVDQSIFLKRSFQFFKDKDAFDIDEFTHEVIVEPQLIDKFQKYKANYQQESHANISDQFAISEAAVRKQTKVYKSILKLDKNFHIYIHGNANLIEQGYDDKKGKRFYKIYFDEEL